MSMESRKRARKKSIDNRQFLIAISENDLEEANGLLKIIDIDFKDRDGCTSLHWAVETGDTKIIDILLKQGAQIHSKNNNNETPMDIAKRMNQLHIVNIFESSLLTDTVDEPKVTEKTKTVVCSRESAVSHDHEVSWITPIHGYIYQLKVLMLFLHRGLSCKYSFRVGTEVKEAEKFDDLVFEYTHGNKKVYRLLQAKHKIDESKKITVDKLLSETKGDYSLVKYFHSFQACIKSNFFKDGFIKDVIICTNIDFDFSQLKKSKIELMKVEEKDDILDMKSNEKEPERYKFTNSIVKRLKSRLKQASSDEEIENFLNHLIFAVNQPNEEELGQIVKKEIGREMSFFDTENAYCQLFTKMVDLMSGKGNSMFLSHEEGKTFFDDLKREMPIWFNVQDPVMSFTGRSEYLKNIQKILMNKYYICISGMGGVGKTELVRKYIADYGHEYDNQIVWINSECYRTAAESFRQLASDKLNISLTNSEGKEKHLTSIIADVYQFFSKCKSLFIFDNTEKYKCANEFDCGIDQFLPCLSNDSIKPRVIITSRNQKWPKSIETVVLEPFKTEEARELVEKVLTVESDKEKGMIAELCNKLQSLPLALQQAVAYINMQKEKLSCIGSTFEISDYLETYSSMAHEFLNSEFPEDSNSSYNKSVFTTWNITFDALKQKEHGKHALDVLNIISYFLPDNIPVELLLIFSNDKVKLSSAIELLKQYSIISVQHKAVNIHRLVQQVVRIKLQKQNDEVKVLQNALMLFNENNISYKNIDYVISMLAFASKHNELIVGYSLLSSHISVKLGSYGRIEESHSISLEALRLLNTLPQSNTYVQVGSLSVKNNIAMAILQKGDYKTALEQLQELYELEIPILGASSSQALTTKSNIALALNHLGRSREALKYYYEILEVSRFNLGDNHPNTLRTKHDISAILSQEGKMQEASSMLQEIYHVQKETLGYYNAQTLKTRNSIATSLGNLSKYDESLEMFKEICNDQEATLPKNHPDILSTKINMAGVLAMQQKYSSALKIYKEVLDVEKQKFGENHPKVIDINVNIAELLKRQGEHEKALQMYEDALKKQQVALGCMHPSTIFTQSAIAEVLINQKKYACAGELCKDLLDKQISVLGNSHANTLATRRMLLCIFSEQKKYDAALVHSLEVLKNVESTFGKGHPSTFSDKNNAGMMYFYTKDFDKALAILTQVLEAQESSLGKDHADYQITKNNITGVTAERNKLRIRTNSKEETDNTKVKSTASNELFTVIKDGNIIQLEQLLKNGADVNSKDINGSTLLHHAVNVGATDIVKFLLKNRADVSLMSNKRNTPLHIATSKNDKESVELLLESVTNQDRLKEFVDFKTKTSGSTCLHIAANKGFYDILISLLKRYATFDIKDNEGRVAVDLANNENVKELLASIQVGFADCVNKSSNFKFYEKLARYSFDEYSAAMNARNSEGFRLLQFVIANKRTDLLNKLLAQKKTKFRQVFPLPTSDITGALKQVDHLISQAENYFQFTAPLLSSLQTLLNPKVSNIDLQFVLGQSFFILKQSQAFVSNYQAYAYKLQFSIDEPNIDTIIQVLDYLEISKVNQSSGGFTVGTTCRCVKMLHSQSKLDIKLFVDLVEIGINGSVHELITRLRSAKLFNAVKRAVNYTEAERYFFEDVDVDLKDIDGRTMLHHASNAADERMVKLLLKHGAEIFVTTNMGNTPLHIAVSKNKVNIVKMMLQKIQPERLNDFVDAKTTSSDSTALHVAAKMGSFDIVKYLLKNHAIFCAINKDGKTPLDTSSHAKIVNFLKIVHELFDSVKEGGAADVVRKLNKLSPEELLAVTNTRNDRGSTLAQVAILNKQKCLAAQILQMVPKLKSK